MYRQGDLLFVRLNSIPKKAEIVADGVIARGEASGHSHRLKPNQQVVLMLLGGLMYIRAKSRADIVHEEHGTITLPPGDYKVIRQREYVPDSYKTVSD